MPKLGSGFPDTEYTYERNALKRLFCPKSHHLAQEVERRFKKPELRPRMPLVRSRSRWSEGRVNVDEMVIAELATAELAVTQA
jgi:hypothetical protein